MHADATQPDLLRLAMAMAGSQRCTNLQVSGRTPAAVHCRMVHVGAAAASRRRSMLPRSGHQEQAGACAYALGCIATCAAAALLQLVPLAVSARLHGMLWLRYCFSLLKNAS